jgi:hypothetical protein
VRYAGVCNAADAEVPGGAQFRRALRCLLDSREHLSQHFDRCTFEFAGDRPPASQAMTSDHMVETARSWYGRMVRQFTLGEEHDATGHVRLTLLIRKVTAQVEVNCSC